MWIYNFMYIDMNPSGVFQESQQIIFIVQTGQTLKTQLTETVGKK